MHHMNLATSQLAQEITTLMSRAAETPGIDPSGLEAARLFDALPINEDFEPYLLRSDGTVIFCRELPNAPQFANDQQSLLHAIVHASKRYPSLARFIPQRPGDSSDCSFCSGTGVCGTLIGSNKPASCPVCVGLGWVASGA